MASRAAPPLGTPRELLPQQEDFTMTTMAKLLTGIVALGVAGTIAMSLAEPPAEPVAEHEASLTPAQRAELAPPAKAQAAAKSASEDADAAVADPGMRDAEPEDGSGS
jgi:hypothetical protein